MTPSPSGRAGGRFLPLSARQLWISAGLGLVLWFSAALLIRALAPMGVFEGAARVWLYLLVIPGTVPFVFLMEKLAGLARSEIALGYSVATTAATLADGVALAWYPELYGGSGVSAAAGAVILWGAGVGLVLSFLRNRAA